MKAHQCPYCQQTFKPSRYRPSQFVCSAPTCQRLRRAAYHRQKLRDDPLYRDQCRESQRHWREQHPNYMKEYRQLPGRKPIETTSNDIFELVKNNLAQQSAPWSGRIYVVGGNGEKNIVATAQVLVITELKRHVHAM